MSTEPAGAYAADVPVRDGQYTDEEQYALGLAAQLRERVGRERATVRQLRTFLVEHDDPHT